MKAHQQTIGRSDEWGTPEWIGEPLGLFDFDPCAMKSRLLPWVANHLTAANDGLNAEWFGRVWLNPPFRRGLRARFMQRMAEHNNGIMLIPAACETEPFRKFVFGIAAGILMLDRRPIFVGADGQPVKVRNKKTGKESIANSGCTICLVAYGEQNLEALKKSGLGTVLREVAA